MNKYINMNKNLNKEDLSSSYLSDISESSQKNKKNYYLYKIGGKLILKKKPIKESSSKKITPKKNSDIKNIISHINSLFNYKYTKMIQYNKTIINRLIFNINSKIVTTFKENLILCDINEFLYRFYEKNKSEQILKKLLNYYEINNIIYPNYISLYEGNYIFNNIEQKQKIIDRQEKLIKNGEKNNNENNKEESILNSNVVESILNQTNTSETKRFFGLKDDNNLMEEDDFEQINDLIKNIDNFEKNEKNGKKNKIIKKKNFIRIINANNNLGNKTAKNNKNSYIKELLSTISYFERLDNKSKIRVQNKKENNNNNINNNQIFSKTNYNNLVIKKNINFNNSKNHKRINTLDTDRIRPKNIILSINNHSMNESNNSFKSPYVIKRPINIDNITYSKKKISQNISRTKNIYIHKNSKSISSFNNYNSNLKLDPEYFNIMNNNNLNRIKIYRKKLQKIYTDQNIKNEKLNINSNSVNKNYRKININQISIPIHTYMSSTRKKIGNLYDSKYKYNRVSPSPNFKLISKMIKTKYLIDDKYNRNINSVSLTARNTVNCFNFKDIKNKNKLNGKDNNNFTTKNIYISNNITNNNFYTINNDPKKHMKLLIYRNNKNKKNNELNKIKANKINIKEYKLDKNGNIYINSDRNQKNLQYQLSNNIKTKDINFKKINKTNIINPYKNGLINSTILKSLDKNSLNSLLNKFRFDNSNVERNISLQNNNIRYTTINEMKHKYNKSFQKKF